jgi:hypothetical protein
MQNARHINLGRFFLVGVFWGGAFGPRDYPKGFEHNIREPVTLVLEEQIAGTFFVHYNGKQYHLEKV